MAFGIASHKGAEISPVGENPHMSVKTLFPPPGRALGDSGTRGFTCRSPAVVLAGPDVFHRMAQPRAPPGWRDPMQEGLPRKALTPFWLSQHHVIF